MLQPIVKAVKPLANYMLYLEFDNGEKKLFDVKPYFDIPFYKPLKSTSVFASVHIVDDWTIEWANGIDIAPHELYDDSVDCESYS